MTPRKELYLKIRDAVGEIAGIEYVNWHRNQFASGKEIPECWTACLIKVVSIKWETMVEQVQEGNAIIEVYLYTKDGFADQHYQTADVDDGLHEIELIDEVVERLQFLKGDLFKPLQQTDDEDEETDYHGLMCHKLVFSSLVYKKTGQKYFPKKLSIP